jgi:membrane-associated protein
MPAIDLLSLGAWAYFAIAALMVADSVAPVIPAEVAVISAGALSARGSLVPAVALLAVVGGAVVGDLLAFGIGGLFRRRTPRRVDAHRAALEAGLGRRGWPMIVACRFVPGGRTCMALLSGSARYPLERFVAASAVGSTLWAVYAGGLGYFGGEMFADLRWSIGLGVVVSVVLAIAVGRVAATRQHHAERV